MLKGPIGRIVQLCLLAVAALSMAACGFQPLYATTSGAGGSGLSNVALVGLSSSQEVQPFIDSAFSNRVSTNLDEAEYELIVTTTEQAERLAVQIDASVTRYNYQLIGRYVLVQRSTGKQFKGNARAIASFNVVSSQYSTLFAEKAAREKAAKTLVNEIERDVLLQIASANEE